MRSHRPAVAFGCVLMCVVAARPAHARELRLVYECVETAAAKPANDAKSKSDSPAVTQQRQLVTVGLGSRYFYSADSSTVMLADFERRRVLLTMIGGREFVDASLYANPAFREMEMANRMGLRKFGEQIGNPGFAGTVLEIETEFGMPSGARPGRGDKLVREGGDRSFFWRLNGDTAVVAEFADSALAPADEAMFGRYLLYMCTLHPDVRAALLAEHRVPRRLTYRWRHLGSTTTVDMTLQSTAVTADSAFEVPPTLAARAALDSTLAATLPAIRDSLRAPRPPMPTAESALAAARHDVESGRALDGLLRMAEYAMRSGHDAPELDKPTQAKLKSDARVRAYQQVVDQISKGAPGKAIAQLQAIDRSDLELGYLMDLELATAHGMLGAQQKAVAEFLGVLRRDPQLGTAWSDLATVFINGYDPWDGWVCVEMARQVAPPNAAYLARFSEHEKRLVKQHPEFF